MSFRSLCRLPLMVLILATLSTQVLAQEKPAAKDEFVPDVGQAGKDVVWVPTAQTLVNKMLDMAKVTAKDYVIDLGSGDGRTVITAAKRGARAHGIEYNPDMVELAKRNAVKAGVADKATFEKADIFQSDYSKATVITLFLLPELNVKLRPTILDMKPGTRVAANSFDMGEWKPDQTARVQGECTSWCTAYLWIVPAKVAGTWKLPQGELTLKQDYQMLSGALHSNSRSTIISNAKMNGDRISFTAAGTQYTGRVNGDSIEGTMKGGKAGNWLASRTAKTGA